MTLIALAGAHVAQSQTPTQPSATPQYTFKIVHAYSHDSQAFTQGLVYYNGFFYEGTGLNGRSSLRKVKIETGEVLQRVDLDSQYFGEGIAILRDQIFQLTWQSQVGFVYRLSDFHLLRQFSYTGEGWGLASNGTDLLMSDGTDEIRVLDGRTLKEKRRIKVHDGATPVTQLNELEIVEGEIFANVWQTDRIARISPSSGKVLGWIDLTGLLSSLYQRRSDAVLNGIAYDARNKRLFVTGKLWPNIFEIRLTPKPSR
jgi:glutamine cyclotransferase